MQPVTAEGRTGGTPPARRRGLWLLALAAVLIPFFVPIPRSLNSHPVIGALGDRLHIPLLFLVLLLLDRWGPLRRRSWLAVLLAMGVGGAIEGLQLFVGRSARWHDFQLDLIGIGLAVCWLAWWRRRTPWAVVGATALVGVALSQLTYLPALVEARYAARERFPLLCDFTHHRTPSLWQARLHATVDYPDAGPPHSTVLRLTGAPPDRWPGALMQYFPADWTAYDNLVFAARAVAPATGALQFCIRLDDYGSRRDAVWYAKRFVADTAWQTYRLPIRDLQASQGERPMQMDDMMSILFYFPAPQDSQAVEIDDLRLERDGP